MLTPQEEFWQGDFGRDYTSRCRVDWQARIPFWRDILDRTKPRSVLEVGCNAGWNMRAIRRVDPGVQLWGCDINAAAVKEAGADGLNVVDASLFELKQEWPESGFDLVCTVGVLIHVGPADLGRAMDSIMSVSNRYVLAVEYADETEVMVPYRDHSERLWRRPFGRLYVERGLRLVAEGRAPSPAFDRCSYWVLERG